MRHLLAAALRRAAVAAVSLARRLDPPTATEREWRTYVLGETFTDETPRQRAHRFRRMERN